MDQIWNYIKAISPRTWIFIAIGLVILVLIILWIKNSSKDKVTTTTAINTNPLVTNSTISVFPLKFGSEGNEVKVVQTYVNSKGEKLVVDGIWGPLTEASVIKILGKNIIDLTTYNTLK